jgi:hypothetical protein
VLLALKAVKTSIKNNKCLVKFKRTAELHAYMITGWIRGFLADNIPTVLAVNVKLFHSGIEMAG